MHCDSEENSANQVFINKILSKDNFTLEKKKRKKKKGQANMRFKPNLSKEAHN